MATGPSPSPTPSLIGSDDGQAGFYFCINDLRSYLKWNGWCSWNDPRWYLVKVMKGVVFENTKQRCYDRSVDFLVDTRWYKSLDSRLALFCLPFLQAGDAKETHCPRCRSQFTTIFRRWGWLLQRDADNESFNVLDATQGQHSKWTR